MASIFTKIVRGEIPCHRVAESEDYLAFLDIRPLSTGHTLVIPKKEIDYFFDLDDDYLGR
ncbi:MAG: HIT domain-containing protein, partial [Saprospiraceae bacterium]|nr:HIT domain-containing protein [Saprospiraceae bacterium]